MKPLPQTDCKPTFSGTPYSLDCLIVTGHLRTILTYLYLGWNRGNGGRPSFLTITLIDVAVTDPGNTYPVDFTLPVQDDGTSATRFLQKPPVEKDGSTRVFEFRRQYF